MQLTPNFALWEFERSDKAIELGIDNAAAPPIVNNLRVLCAAVLEPWRWLIGVDAEAEVPMEITSGYRCRALNKVVKGVALSRHLTGEGADCKPVGFDVVEAFASLHELAMDGIPVDKAILYAPERGGHVHVAYSTTIEPRRRFYYRPAEGALQLWKPPA